MRRSAVAVSATLALAVLALGGPFRSPRLLPGTGGGEEEPAPVDVSVPEPGPAVPVDVPVTVPLAGPVDACTEALQWVEAAGLTLPAGVGYNCPSTEFAHHGAACWNAWPCPGRTGFIAINTALIGNAGTDYLHHVVAHEVCHIVDFRAKGTSTEASADACAAAHGAPA